MLANKAEVNAKGSNGNTALHLAVGKDHKEVVEVLLANKAEVNAVADDGMAPSHLAAVSGYKDILELLLANNAEVGQAKGRRDAFDLGNKHRAHGDGGIALGSAGQRPSGGPGLTVFQLLSALS